MFVGPQFTIPSRQYHTFTNLDCLASNCLFLLPAGMQIQQMCVESGHGYVYGVDTSNIPNSLSFKGNLVDYSEF